MATTQTRRVLGGMLAAGGLLLFPLAGCTGDEANTGTSVLEDTEAAVSSASEAADAAAESATEAADAVSDAVDCSGSSCSVTLDAESGSVEVLGTTMSFDGIQDGEATVSVGDQEVSCSEGESVEAGPLSLECSAVSEEGITLTATLG